MSRVRYTAEQRSEFKDATMALTLSLKATGTRVTRDEFLKKVFESREDLPIKDWKYVREQPDMIDALLRCGQTWDPVWEDFDITKVEVYKRPSLGKKLPPTVGKDIEETKEAQEASGLPRKKRKVIPVDIKRKAFAEYVLLASDPEHMRKRDLGRVAVVRKTLPAIYQDINLSTLLQSLLHFSLNDNTPLAIIPARLASESAPSTAVPQAPLEFTVNTETPSTSTVELSKQTMVTLTSLMDDVVKKHRLRTNKKALGRILAKLESLLENNASRDQIEDLSAKVATQKQAGFLISSLVSLNETNGGNTPNALRKLLNVLLQRTEEMQNALGNEDEDEDDDDEDDDTPVRKAKAAPLKEQHRIVLCVVPKSLLSDVSGYAYHHLSGSPMVHFINRSSQFPSLLEGIKQTVTRIRKSQSPVAPQLRIVDLSYDDEGVRAARNRTLKRQVRQALGSNFKVTDSYIPLDEDEDDICSEDEVLEVLNDESYSFDIRDSSDLHTYLQFLVEPFSDQDPDDEDDEDEDED